MLTFHAPSPTKLHTLLSGIVVGGTATVEDPLEPLTVTMDPLLLTHILNNAISNAHKYGRGTPVLKYHVERDRLIMTLRNEPGPRHAEFMTLIAEQEDHRIKLYSRTRGTLACRSEKATAIGTTICRLCAALMEASVWLAADPEGVDLVIDAPAYYQASEAVESATKTTAEGNSKAQANGAETFVQRVGRKVSLLQGLGSRVRLDSICQCWAAVRVT